MGSTRWAMNMKVCQILALFAASAAVGTAVAAGIALWPLPPRLSVYADFVPPQELVAKAAPSSPPELAWPEAPKREWVGRQISRLMRENELPLAPLPSAATLALPDPNRQTKIVCSTSPAVSGDPMVALTKMLQDPDRFEQLLQANTIGDEPTGN